MVSVKLNCQDFLYPEGVSERESIALAKMLENAGVDLVEVSGGTYETLQCFGYDPSVGCLISPISSLYEQSTSSQTSSRDAYFIDFASRLRPHLSHTKICITGGFRSTSTMAGAIRSDLTDGTYNF